MVLSTNRINRLSLTSIALITATLLMSACHNEFAPRGPTLAASTKEASSWDTLPQGDALRAAEQTYRACAMEAAQLHLAVKEFPEISDRVTYLTQDGQRVRKTEQASVNIDDMHVDNGCATRIVKSISIDVVSDSAQATSIDETGKTLARHGDTQISPSGSAHLTLAVAKKAQSVPTCTLIRDPGPQSHFMMLNLCRSEERRAEQEQQAQEEFAVHPRKISPATSS
ncbi:hypothetical protein hmeg3_22130 [Herbaspirillum sp. meg3]|uniref:hypothetical protein n=1 Tax=Herbaspirillum sp. meg3 TaxID=2025949 RepID=UPI000B98A8A5|nr:hypothetical protein [Herbaspirillum sp. meg3]ASU40735.1 hypothetical protein hmeg3_22130 [Herbaspirillum sp. meg3]